VQGLALGTGRRIVAVSALEALAQCGGGAPGTFVAAWIDARRHDVFAALYRVTDAAVCSPERLVEVEGPSVGNPAATLTRWRSRIGDVSVLFVGDGAVLYADTIHTIAASASAAWTLLPETPLLAGAIGQMAILRAERGDTIDPAAVRPLYVRRPDAEVERERKTVQPNGQ
jgi:tRNA A37 threonylcarbamoyladenosine modification protein TsaB